MLVKIANDWIDPTQVLCLDIRVGGGPTETAHVHIHWRIPDVAPLVIHCIDLDAANATARKIADAVNRMASAEPQEPPT